MPLRVSTRPPLPMVTLSLWYTPLAKQSTTLVELALFGILGALTFGLKVVMAGLPNIEPVSLMVLLFGAVFGRKALYPTYVYVAMEFFLYGLNLWSINYLYVWPILALIGWLMRKNASAWVWALTSGAFGLFFGMLCAPVYVVINGWAFAVSWWISGIPFDLLHGAGNFVIALVLFVPLRKVVERMYGKMCPT